MGVHSFFMPDIVGAQQFFDCVPTNTMLNLFKESFYENASNFGVRYHISKNKNGLNIKCEEVNINIGVTLNNDGTFKAANVIGSGPFMKVIRNSIWETKTFFTIPVLSVVNTSFDDEDLWEDYPRQFTVLMVTPDNIDWLE